MVIVILFIFGLAIGSFLNVVALRYDGEHFVFNTKKIGGRSHCPHCKKILQWYELFPLFSFIIQNGKCRNCHARIGIQYPIVELLSGLIFAFVPLGAWTAVFEVLLLIAYIDIRLGIIPDELNILLVALGILIGALSGDPNFLLPFFWGHFLGALAAGGFFSALVLVTPYIFKQEGMGMGDVKLAAALGFLFGWPMIVLLTGAAFILGAVIGVLFIMLHRKTMRETLPFGPFLAVAAALVFFWGTDIVQWYLRIAGL